MNTRPLVLSTALFGALSLSLLPAGSVSAQTTATTDPVGYITLGVSGTHGSGSAALSFLGQGMTRPVEFQSTSKSASGTALTDTSAGFVDDQFNTVTSGGVTTGSAYYVEITSGPGVGLWSDIVSTNGATTSHSGTPNTLYLTADLSSYLTAGTTYKVRKNWTISAVFGVNPTAAGASGLSGGTLSTADQVLVYTPATYTNTGTLVKDGFYTTYYYKTSGLGGTGWRSSASNSVDAANAKFEPSDGLLVQRNQATDLSFALVGAVKLGTSDLTISSGLNLVSNVYPSGTLTLGNSGLYNPSDVAGNTLVGGTLSNADQVLIYQPAVYDASNNLVTAGVYKTYYYKTSGLGGTGWRSSSSNSVDASGTAIPFGNAILIQRNNKTVRADGSFEWVAPQPF